MIIRECKENDSKSILKMLLALDKETKYMMFEEDERPNDISRVEAMIMGATKGDNIFLVVEADNEIVGFLSAQRGVPKKIKHTAYVVTGIREKYRGIGIGSKLFSELDSWAVENNIIRLELTVMCPNLAARKLYEKSGFKIEGVKEKSILMDGVFFDEYYMAKIYKW